MSQHPRNSWLAQTLGRLVLKITGWKVSGVLPVEPRSVIIAAQPVHDKTQGMIE